MDKLETLITTIMREAEKDGEPVTREEAEEMAKMEINANKDLKRYEKSEKTRKKVEKVRKVDEEKKFLLSQMVGCLNTLSVDEIKVKTETEISFQYGDNAYTLKLTKHRPPKA